MTMDNSIKPGSPKREAVLFIEIIRSKSTVSEARRSFDLTLFTYQVLGLVLACSIMLLLRGKFTCPDCSVFPSHLYLHSQQGYGPSDPGPFVPIIDEINRT